MPSRLSKESPGALLLLTEYSLLRKRLIGLFDCGKYQVGEDDFEANLPGNKALHEIYESFSKLHLLFLHGMVSIEQPIAEVQDLLELVSKLENEIFDQSRRPERQGEQD